MKNVLVINLARFGDIIQSHHMLACIKKQAPDAHISYMVNKAFASVCALLPEIDETIEIDFRKLYDQLLFSSQGILDSYTYLDNFFGSVRDRNYDTVFNVTPHFIGLYAAYLSGMTEALSAEISDWSRYHISISRNWRLLSFHIADLFKNITGSSGYTVQPPVLNITAESREYACRFLCEQGVTGSETVIGFHTGASSSHKEWPLDNFHSLASALIDRDPGTRIILFGSSPEASRLNSFCKGFGPRVINAAGKTDCIQLAALLEKTDVLVSNDSGPMHLAAACGTKVISIHTGKEKCSSTGPYGTGHLCIEPSLPCHPCEFPEQCTSRACIRSITPETVLSAVLMLVNNSFSSSQASTSNVESVTISKTCFDHDGYFDCIPLNACCDSFSAVARRIIRTVCCYTFDSSAAFDNHYTTRKAVSIVEGLRGTYSHPPDLQQWEKQAAHLSNLILLCRKGSQKAGALSDICSDTHANSAALREAACIIDKTDASIISIGSRSPLCAPFTAMCMFEKEKLRQGTVFQMASATVAMYERLYRRCSLLLHLGTEVFTSLNDTSHTTFVQKGGTYGNMYKRFADVARVQ